MSHARSTAGVVAAVVIAVACSGPDQPASVVVSPHTLTLRAVGVKKQLTASVTDKGGKSLTGAVVSWTSDDDGVAKVDQMGLVTAVGAGVVMIKANTGTLGDSAQITVAQVPASIEAASGTSQAATVGQALPQPITVRVRDSLSAPIANVAVTLTVSQDGGSVDVPSGTTDADGEFSATWTLGTKSGSFQTTAAVAGVAKTAVFSATATPGPANNLARVGGDNQFGFKGTRLAGFIAVRVRDQYGNGVPSYSVQFTAAAGTADSAVAFTDATGVARTTWLMPASLSGTADTITLEAQASASGTPLLGSPLSFTAVAHSISVASASPSPMIEGQSAVLTGTGFDAGNTQNVVTIDGEAVAVTTATASQLTVMVPTSDCKPARTVTVQVTVWGIPAATISQPLSPAQPALSLAPGQQVILRDPAAFCFQFAPSATSEAYLVGVQSTSETVTDLQPITLVNTVPGEAFAAPLASPRPTTARSLRPVVPAGFERWLQFGRAEVRRRILDRQLFQQLRAMPCTAPLGAPKPPPVDSSVAVGDTVALTFAGGSCSQPGSLKAVVKAKGRYGIFLDDVANPSPHYADTTFARFSQTYDSKIYPADTLEFGRPGDADHNGRVVIVVTQKVNRLGGGELGFVTSCDFFPLGTDGSNGGEFTYIVAPDASGGAGFTYNPTLAARDLIEVIAHESVHIIQFGRRLAAGGDFPDIWLAEGQAVLGEEVVGDTLEHHVPRTNSLGFAQATNLDDTTSTDFYGLAFSALGLYFGWDPLTTPGVSNHLFNAPWECSWLDEPPFNPEPCVGGVDPYGAPWLLLRYLSDRFNGTHAGGEAGIQHALIDNTLNGYALVQSVIGVPMDSLLPQFAAMLYVDDLVSGAPEISEASWNLHDVFYGSCCGFSLRPELRLTPQGFSLFASFGTTARVRAGSTYYAVVDAPTHPADALKARDDAGNVLPAKMRYWIVRLR